MRSNLEKLLDQSTEADWSEGCLAYQRYHHTLRRFAEYYDFGIVPTVEAFAALSPNNDYHGNLRSLAGCLNAAREGRRAPPTVSTYASCAYRAMSYLRGDVSFLDTVEGPKITAFRHNLLYPHDSKMVTVDGHIFAAFMGEAAWTMKDAAMGLNRTAYFNVASAIRKIALRHKKLPHQIQATLWITRKRINSIKLDSQPDLFFGFDDAGKAQCNPEDYPPYPEKETP